MKKSIFKVSKLVALSAMLPFIYGCGGGGGAGSLIGFLFGGGIGGGAATLLASSAGASSAAGAAAGSGASVATLVNPEPASMLLVGSGLVAMGYFKSKNRRSQ